MAQAAKDLEDFASKGYFSENIESNVYPAGQNQEFAPGDAAIIICGSWLPNEIKDSVSKDLKWDTSIIRSIRGTNDQRQTTLQTRYLRSTRIQEGRAGI
ncbi:hypothetical protein [Suipraeoptans intestinalis]|uniref:hypothetical protein n=1 Tax=Suipraeoptans intestinalis TaxID=2606628 RepID=UPI0019D50CC9|nr:hypothetical protein [Suipraeoptans intestinalis]